jgi:hypothetical protein
MRSGTKVIWGLLCAFASGCAAPSPPVTPQGATQNPCEVLSTFRQYYFENQARAQSLLEQLQQRYAAKQACLDAHSKSVGGLLSYYIGFDCTSDDDVTNAIHNEYDEILSFLKENQQFIAPQPSCASAGGSNPH